MDILIRSRCHPAELMRRIEEGVDRERFSLWSLSGYAGGKALLGKFSEDRFRLRHSARIARSRFRNAVAWALARPRETALRRALLGGMRRYQHRNGGARRAGLWPCAGIRSVRDFSP
jgi:hypothetical protein